MTPPIAPPPSFDEATYTAIVRDLLSHERRKVAMVTMPDALPSFEHDNQQVLQ